MGKIAALLFDLDGTIYRGGDAIPGACEFIASLQRRKISYLFVTNRGNRRPELVAKQILSIGIPCCAENVLTSSQAVATHLEKGTRAYCIGEEGLTSILEDHGIRVLEDATEEADAVIVSYDRDFNYDKQHPLILSVLYLHRRRSVVDHELLSSTISRLTASVDG